MLAVLAVVVPALAVLAGASPAGAVRVGVAVVLAVAVEAAVRVVGSTPPLDGRSTFATVARGPERAPDAPPPRLAGWQRAMEHGTGSVGGWHFRLRPALRDLADGVLDRNGVRLDRDPELARELLGDRVWGRLRPDVPDPNDRWAAGLAAEELEQIVRRIEELRWG